MRDRALYKHNSGFTLLEITVVLVIVGILIATLARLFTPYYQTLQWERSMGALAEVERATKLFLAQNDRYPCPARAAMSDGEEDCSIAPLGSAEWDGTSSNILVGAVPYRTLGIGMRTTIDAYGGPMTYAVTLNSAVNADFAEENENRGAVQVVDSVGSSVSRRDASADGALNDVWQHYFFFSEGRTRCNGPGVGFEAENCDGDAVFRHMEQSHGVQAQYFDDLTRFYVFKDDDDIWRRTEENENDIRSLNAENVGIGLDQTQPVQAKLHIAGNVFVSPDGSDAPPGADAVQVHGRVVSERINQDGNVISRTFNQAPGVGGREWTSYFIAETLRGSRSAPEHLRDGDVIGTIEARGAHQIMGEASSIGSGIQIVATQNHNSIARGSELRFLTAANDSAMNSVVHMTLGQDGLLQVGTAPNDAQDRAGTLVGIDRAFDFHGGGSIAMGLNAFWDGGSMRFSGFNRMGWDALSGHSAVFRLDDRIAGDRTDDVLEISVSSDTYNPASGERMPDSAWNRNQLTLARTGNVGINIGKPATTLDVGGAIKIGNDGLEPTCTPEQEGALRYNPGATPSEPSRVDLCDGAVWSHVNDTPAWHWNKDYTSTDIAPPRYLPILQDESPVSVDFDGETTFEPGIWFVDVTVSIGEDYSTAAGRRAPNCYWEFISSGPLSPRWVDRTCPAHQVVVRINDQIKRHWVDSRQKFQSEKVENLYYTHPLGQQFSFTMTVRVEAEGKEAGQILIAGSEAAPPSKVSSAFRRELRVHGLTAYRLGPLPSR